MTERSATGADLLNAARMVLEDSSALPKACWPRACALLARQALESALEAWWAARAPGMAMCDRTTQLRCLPWYLDQPETARLAHITWAGLSAACHHHAYELGPTAAELAAWLDDVDRVLAVLVVGDTVGM